MTKGDAQDWLAHAEADLHYAKLGQNDPGTLENLVAFHAQQAVEKALKAVLVQYQVEFPKTHDLEQLLVLIKSAGLTWPPEMDKAKEFTPFAIQSRYPGFDDPLARAEVDEAIAVSEKVLEWAKQEIAKSDRGDS
ncbi:MAG: HEPN domain-containing protein [Chloroflexi bacterium]|nr:HEPN domain-containing protein [Chloroflexota bacterium]